MLPLADESATAGGEGFGASGSESAGLTPGSDNWGFPA
jgi:hypothetical protein